MSQVVLRIIILLLGLLALGSVMLLEIDGTVGFLLATLGLFLLIISFTLRGLIALFANLI